jgi:hypothetical protein
MAERDNPEASGHLPGHFVEAAEAGGLTSSLPASDGDRVAASRYAISDDRRALRALGDATPDTGRAVGSVCPNA